MQQRDTYSRNRKPVVEAAIVGFALATLFYKLHGVVAQGCSLFHKMAWIALGGLRPVILAACHSVPDCLYQDSSFLQNALQIVASVWPLLCVMAS